MNGVAETERMKGAPDPWAQADLVTTPTVVLVVLQNCRQPTGRNTSIPTASSPGDPELTIGRVDGGEAITL